jgi:hypothetical protein
MSRVPYIVDVGVVSSVVRGPGGCDASKQGKERKIGDRENMITPDPPT